MMEFLRALAATPRRVVDALADPARRLRGMIKIGRVAADFAAAVAAWHFLPLVVDAAAVIALDFALYEFLLEPWSKARLRRGLRSLVGPYWEGAPHVGLGERYRRP